MHEVTINVKREHEFEREQGEIYGRLWRNKREWRNDVIITSKLKEKGFFKSRGSK